MITDWALPFTFRCGAVARNRIALAALTNQQSHEDGSLSDEEFAWLARRAQGGFGLVATCAAHVAMDGKGFDGQLGIFADAQLPGLTRLATALREHGSLGIVQLYHGGVRSPSRLTGQRPWSASEFAEATQGFEPPRAATADDIARAIVQFREAAVRADRAGFAGVELHSAHGYLFSQFLSRTMNQRDDEWGGPLEHRARLLRETFREVRSSVRPGFVVGVRLSHEDFGNARGIDLDETLEVTRWLCDDGVDFIHASLWDAFANTKKRPDAHPIPLFRAAMPDSVALIVAGKVWTPAEVAQLLGLGADIVALGRAGIVNPDWPREATAENWTPRRPPLTPEELAARAVSPRFVQYLRRWRGFVADASSPASPAAR